jgi:hypothetical protein
MLLPDRYLSDCAQNCKAFQQSADAKKACDGDIYCGGITQLYPWEEWTLQSTTQPMYCWPNGTVSHASSYTITNAEVCHVELIKRDPAWFARGAAAYAGLNRTDPNAIWSFQGWAFVHWDGGLHAGYLKSFIDVRSVCRLFLFFWYNRTNRMLVNHFVKQYAALDSTRTCLFLPE